MALYKVTINTTVGGAATPTVYDVEASSEAAAVSEARRRSAANPQNRFLPKSAFSEPTVQTYPDEEKWVSLGGTTAQLERIKRQSNNQAVEASEQATVEEPVQTVTDSSFSAYADRLGDSVRAAVPGSPELPPTPEVGNVQNFSQDDSSLPPMSLDDFAARKFEEDQARAYDLPEDTFGPNPALVAEDNPEFQFQQFLSGLGRRKAGTSGAAGRARLGRFSSNQARFLADQALNPLSRGQAGTFADFTAREPLYGQQANQNASDLFDQAIRLGSGINPTGAGFDNFSEMQQGFLNPVDERGAAQFENLARAKARSQFGVASEFFQPNVSAASQYFAQDAPSAMSFGDFLNNKIFGQAAPGQQMNLGKIGTPVPGFSDDTRSQFEAFAPGMGY
jgi:hypothetical protein